MDRATLPILLAGFLTALTALTARGEITEADRAAHPGMRAWEVDYAKPEEVKDVVLYLRYDFWDPKVDGDVPSGRDLQVVRLKAAPARLAIKIFIGPRQSIVRVNELPERTGSGVALDSSYALAAKPRANYNGFYILAQAPDDPKHPAPIGEVMEAASWVQLGIDLRP